MKHFSIFLTTLSLLLILIGGFFLGFEQIALDPGVYDRIQADLNVYEAVGLSPEAQSRVNAVLADYLRGDRQDILIEESLFGQVQQVFNSDERAHMVDVYNLFALERAVRAISLTAGFLLFALSACLPRKHARETAIQSLKALGLTLLLLATAAILLYVFCGFERLFLLFHELLFTNDLWLMNPATDAMIRMLPTGFFMRIAAESGLSALLCGLLLTAATWLLLFILSIHSRRKQTP